MDAHSKIFSHSLLFAFVILGFAACNPGKKQADHLNRTDQNGLKQGPWEFYEDTIRIARGSYVDDKREGLWTFWYTNGMTKEEGNYHRGERTGIWVEWLTDGEILWKGEYKNGVRQIEWAGAMPEVTVLGKSTSDRVLFADSIYRVKITLQNIPSENLYVEVSGGEIIRENDPEMFILRTPSDTLIKLAIGYIPDLEFKDFRNLVDEIEFKLRKIK